MRQSPVKAEAAGSFDSYVVMKGLPSTCVRLSAIIPDSGWTIVESLPCGCAIMVTV